MAASQLFSCGGKVDLVRDEVEWEFGDVKHSVIAAPVSDGERIYVVAAERTVERPENALRQQRCIHDEAAGAHDIYLAALDLRGRELWRATICDTERGMRVYDGCVPPVAIGVDGDIWAHCDVISRFSRDGMRKWATPMPHESRGIDDLPSKLALTPTGFGAALIRDGFVSISLQVYGPDGLLLLDKRIDLQAPAQVYAEFTPFQTGLAIGAGPVVHPDGRIYGPCDDCLFGEPPLPQYSNARSALLAYDPVANDLETIPIEPAFVPPAGYGQMTIADGATLLAPLFDWLNDERLLYEWDGNSSNVSEIGPTLAEVLVSSGGPIVNAEGKIRWDDSLLDFVHTYGEIGTFSPTVLAIAKPDTLIEVDQEGRIIGRDRNGTTRFTFPREFTGHLEHVVVLPGQLIFRDGAKIISRRVPLDGLADVPWPSLGGGNRNAYAKER